MTKILFLFSNFHQRDFTGQPGTVWELVQHVGDRFETSVISNGNADQSGLLGRTQVRIFKSRGDQTLQYLLRLPICVVQTLRIKPDLIHAHGLPLIVYAKLLAWITRTPLVCSFNEDITLRPTWLQLAIACCTNRSRAVFVSCDYFRDRLLGLGVRADRIRVAAFGLKPQFLAETAAAAADTDFLYFGDARKSRGFDIVCRLAEKLPRYSFSFLIRWRSITGDLDHEKALRLPNVKILYYPYERSLIDFIRGAKVLLLPYRTTSPILPPMSLAEAMALGRCVVTTRLPGTDELCEDGRTVHLINPDDTDAAVALAEKLMADEAGRLEMGRQARQRILNLFKNQYEAFASAYAQVTA